MTQTFEQTTSRFSDIDSTVGREVVELSSNVIDEFATHSALNEKLDILHVDGGLSGQLDIARVELIEGIVDDSHDLAAQILTKEQSLSLGIKARIEDNAGFHHPPKIQDVEILGHAWDATGDKTTLQAIKLALEEVEGPEAEVAKKAIEVAELDEEVTFRESYLQGLERQMIEGIARELGATASVSSFMDINAVTDPSLKDRLNSAVSEKLDRFVTVHTTTAYFDTNPSAPSQDDYARRKDELRNDFQPLDETEERLIIPLAFPDVELEQVIKTSETDNDGNIIETAARIDIPMVLLPDKEIIKNIRTRRLAEAARNEAVAARDEDTVKKINEMRDAIYTSRGFAEY